MAAYARLLGSPAVRFEGGQVELAPLKITAVLLYLAYRNAWVNREELLYLFWPDTLEEKARRNLRQLLTKIRRLDYAKDLETEEARLRWRIATDVHDFRGAIAARRWPQAVQLYGGKLLAGLVLHDAPEFESWLEFERQELHGAWREAVLALASQLEADGRHSQAAELLGRLMKADPLDEAILRRYLQARYLSGERSEALQKYESFKETLQRELDGEPEEVTLRLAEAIQRGEPLDAVSARNIATLTKSARAEKAQHNMPHQATPFVGRSDEIAAVTHRLGEPSCRLLTLVGPGGIGKTRLAIEAAQAQLDTFADGVWFVPLAPLSSADFMVAAIADALDFAFFGSDEPKTQLLSYLRGKEILLVLDNFEHLLGGVGLLAEIAKTALWVKLLVTSRERLNLQAEWVFDLEGLSFPAGGDIENIQDYDAVQLFTQTAERARADFALDGTNAREVARICQLVEGMPLAIELAAGWLRILVVADIADELAKGLDVLEASSHDMPARHRSLRAVFDHSWTLLFEGERLALRALSIFHGGFTKEAAHEVAEVSLPLLLALGNKSFLRRETSGRFTQHPLLWQYLREKARGDAVTFSRIQEKHAAYFAAFLDERKDRLHGWEAKTAREEIERELANVREAWFWAVAQGREDLLDQALESLYVFYNDEGRYHEAEMLFSAAVRDPTTKGVILGRALCFLGGCYNFLTAYDKGIEVLERSLPIFRASESKRDEGLALLILCSCYSFTNRPLEEDTAILRRCLRLFYETGDLAHEGETLGLLAEFIKNPAEAERQFHESIRLFRESNRYFGMLGGMPLALGNFAQFLAHAQGSYQQAIDLLGESIRIEQARGETYRLVWYLNRQAEYLIYQGEHREAEHLLIGARTAGEALESGWGQLELDRALYGLGWLAHLRGESNEAKYYLTYVLNQIETHGDAFGTGASAMDILGCIALAEGNLDEAADLCQEALRFFSSLNPQRSGRDWAKLHCLSHLADIALAQGDIQTAHEYLNEALTITREWHLLPAALHLCVSFADLFGHQGDQERAASLLYLAGNHPASMFQTKEAAQQRLEALPNAVVAAGQERAKPHLLSPSITFTFLRF